MPKLIKYTITIVSIFIVTSFASAQVQILDSTQVDSLTFKATREVLNKLPTDKFQKQVFLQAGKQLPYRLLIPKNYTENKKYPLVITFHNSTRIGNDNENQLEPLSKIWIRNEIYDHYNCFVIAPQFNTRSSNYVANDGGILISRPSDDVNLVLELLKNVEKTYPNVDKSRIYLVGYSMGASTAQNIMSLAPQKFAAMVSVAAVPDFSNLKAIKTKNIFLIHGAKDTENPYEGSVELFKMLKNNSSLIFKTFTALDHNNINIPLLLTDEIPKWLFSK